MSQQWFQGENKQSYYLLSVSSARVSVYITQSHKPLWYYGVLYANVVDRELGAQRH